MSEQTKVAVIPGANVFTGVAPSIQAARQKISANGMGSSISLLSLRRILKERLYESNSPCHTATLRAFWREQVAVAEFGIAAMADRLITSRALDFAHFGGEK